MICVNLHNMKCQVHSGFTNKIETNEEEET